MHLNPFLLLLCCLCGCLASSSAAAMDCETGQRIEHTFPSSASWRLCAVIDAQHGLELQDIHYQAPGDISRSVLSHLHLGQALLHYHNKPNADVLIGENKLGGAATKTLGENVCKGTLYAPDNTGDKMCSYVRDTGLLAKYSMQPGLQGQQFRLFSVSEYQGLTFQIQVGLSEDGRISPSVTLSGNASQNTTDTRFGNPVVNPLDNETFIATQATVLYTWRMAFSLNDAAPNDTVEEFNFKLEPSLGSRRPMQVTKLSTETLRNKNRDQFRGWRVKDINGSGYYLDPQNSGYGYADRQNNWAQFDLAITAFKDCERHSRLRSVGDALNSQNACDGSLDDFVNGESLSDANPVLWYSQSRVFRPKTEDYPIISSMPVEFDLLPFDWTPSSPFEVKQ